MAWLDELKLNADARVAVIHLATIDEEEAMRALAGWSQSGEWPKGMGLITWDIGDQFRHLREPAATFSKLSATPETVLDIIDDYKGSATFVLKDFHHFLEHSRKVSRMLRNLASRLPFRTETVNIIITTPRFALPAELAHDIPTIDVGKPDGKQMLELLERETRSTRSLDNATHGLRERLVESALGLSVVEAGRAFRKAIVVAGGQGLDERSVRQVLNEKRHIIRESGALELYPCTGSMNNVGGLGALKGWLEERQEAFSQDAREYGLSMPKGVALIGIPGTGKSLCAKVTAGHWGMTLLRMDVGAIFSGLLGSSEQNIREAIRIAEVIAPCVLWVDEIEKAFAGSMGDSGTASRVFHLSDLDAGKNRSGIRFRHGQQRPAAPPRTPAQRPVRRGLFPRSSHPRRADNNTRSPSQGARLQYALAALQPCRRRIGHRGVRRRGAAGAGQRRHVSRIPRQPPGTGDGGSAQRSRRDGSPFGIASGAYRTTQADGR